MRPLRRGQNAIEAWTIPGTRNCASGSGIRISSGDLVDSMAGTGPAWAARGQPDHTGNRGIPRSLTERGFLQLRHFALYRRAEPLRSPIPSRRTPQASGKAEGRAGERSE